MNVLTFFNHHAGEGAGAGAGARPGVGAGAGAGLTSQFDRSSGHHILTSGPPPSSAWSG